MRNWVTAAEAHNLYAEEFQRESRWNQQYRPTHSFSGRFINRSHLYFASCPRRGLKINIGITGSLRPEDALKLYEMAFFSTGDILELGCSYGLSTYVIAQAIRDSGKSSRFDTVDINMNFALCTRRTLNKHGLTDYVNIWVGDAGPICESFSMLGRKFGFVFVDHSHEYRPVSRVCRQLSNLLDPGGYCLFHDYIDRRNIDLFSGDYRVFQATRDFLPVHKFGRVGIYGCAALYRREPSFSGHSVN